MKQTLNKIFSALLALVLCVGLFLIGVTPASATEASGTCGKDLTWSLENGVLTISGTGTMNNYDTLFVPPWNLYSHLVQRIVVNDGVASIGDRAFYGMRSLTTVILPASVKSLGEMAFYECIALKQIAIPGVETIGWGCFFGCLSLNNITLPECLRTIGGQAFYQCTKLSGITIPVSVEEMGIMVFSYCSNLVYVNIKAPLNVLPNWTFYGCVLLWEVYLPSSIQEVETNALGECPSLYYVDYGGSQDVKEEIAYQLSQPTTMEPGEDISTDVNYSENKNSTITTSDNGYNAPPNGGNSSDVTIDATINNPEGWEDVVEEVIASVSTGRSPNVTVQVQENVTMEEGSLSSLVDKNVTITVEMRDNVSWEILMKDQTTDTLSGSQDFAVAIVRDSGDLYQDILEGSVSYSITLGRTSLNSTLKVPLGKETARKTATLYAVDSDGLRKLTSVIVDDDGMAAFCLAGTEAGDYVIGLDVPGIDKAEVIIPKKLAPEYGIEYTYGATLTDAYGNQYVLTGRVNKLGFGIGTLTLIIVGVLVGSIVVVGAVMVIWNKQQKRMYKQRHTESAN